MNQRALPDLPNIYVVRSGRSPHSIALAVGLMSIAVYGLAFTTPSGALDEGLTATQRILFGVCASFGALLILLGVYRRNLRTGLAIERAGQLLLGTGAVIYVIVLCIVSTFASSGIIVTMACAVAIGSLWRMWQITHDLRAIRDVILP